MFVTITQWVMHEISQYGLWAVFIGMIIESACIPLPSEIIMPFGGVLVQQGHFNILSVAFVGAFGNFIGGSLAYFAGRTGGRRFVARYGRYIFLSSEHLEKAQSWFNKRGEATVFFSRMVPGVRTFISLPAGIAHMNYWRFAIYTVVGSFPWALGLAAAGYFFGKNWGLLNSYIEDFNYILWALLVIAIAIFIRRHKKAPTKSD